MGRFDGILLISDMDGTLLNSKTNSIDKGNIDAINLFTQEGGRFAFATGRIRCEIEDFDALIPSGTYNVCCNGGLLDNFRTEKTEIICTVEDDIIVFLDRIEREFPKIAIEITHGQSVYICHPNEGLEQHKSISSIPIIEVGDYRETPKPWMKIALWGCPDEVTKLENGIKTEDVPENYTFRRTYKWCCEVMPKGADKGIAMLKYRRILPDIRKICAVGDYGNDELMLKNADISFAPSNASDEVKKIATYNLKSDCNHSAVAEAIGILGKLADAGKI